MIRAFTLIVLLLTLSGCFSPGRLTMSDVDRPLAELQKIAAKCVPLGLRTTSPNGREFYSNYFQAHDRKFKSADKQPERRYAQITILGDRRPYKVEVTVLVERTDTSSLTGYSAVATDLGLADVVKNRVLQQLNKRREDLNIIDDFRVF